MCLITFAYKTHPEFDLILLANRDEFRNRSFEPAHKWGKVQKVISGIDLSANGTWTGVTESGRIAVITNYRQGLDLNPELRSRGELATSFLDSDMSPQNYLELLRESKDSFNGYNILFGDRDALIWYCNINDLPQFISPGVYGLSNSLLDTQWPKVNELKTRFYHKLELNQVEPDQLMPLMLDKLPYPESQLPNTGIEKNLEIGLSPIFVDLEGYGTVLTTLIYMGKQANSLVEYMHLDHANQLSCCHSSQVYTFNSQV